MTKAVVDLTADRPAGNRLLQDNQFPTKIARASKDTLAGFKATAEATARAAVEPPAAFSRRGFGNFVYCPRNSCPRNSPKSNNE